MKNWGIVILLLIVITGFKLHFEQEALGNEKVIFADCEKNELVQICDGKGIPIAYYRDVYQYPCVDSVCERMQVRIYWDIWGHFLRLALPESQELTKIGHKPFTERDYSKLHKLLINPKSNVQYYDLHNLTEQESEHAYYSLDGMTGATVTEVKYETVKGAVKTCYALWHIIYNDTTINQIKTASFKALKLDNQQDNERSDVDLAKMAEMIGSGFVATDSFIEKSTETESNDANYWACVLELARNTDDNKRLLKKCLTDKQPGKNSLINYALFNFLQEQGIRNKGFKKFDVSYKKPITID